MMINISLHDSIALDEDLSANSLEVSVIICTFNRAESLRLLLNSITRLRYQQSKIEIIVVDDGSRDHTNSVCAEFSEVLPNLKYIPQPENQGQSVAAYIGISHAETDKLLFTDDDCIVDPDWVTCMVEELQAHALVAGRIKSEPHPYLALSQNISEFNQFMGLKPKENCRFLVGANMGIRKGVFEKIGKFYPIINSYDTNISLLAGSKGYPIHFSPRAVIDHFPVKKSLRDLWKYECERSFVTIRLRNEYKNVLQTPFFLRSSVLLFLFSPAIAIGKTFMIYFHYSFWRQIHSLPIVLYLKLAWCWGALKGLESMGK
jgi:glycosyltransferase involved in cell wall biosynthesis